MRYKNDEITIQSSSNPKCPACKDKRLHSKEEFKEYHPLAGTGHSREHGSPLKKNDK